MLEGFVVNIFIILFFYPILAYYLNRGLKEKRLSIVPFVILSCGGLVYAYMSTCLHLTFSWNLLDIISIHAFLFSLLVLIVFYGRLDRILQLVVITVFLLFPYCFLFGPSELCGQALVYDSVPLRNNMRLYNSGHQYGFMDYGSRITVSELTPLGFEKAIGYAINANHFYGEEAKFDIDSEYKYVIVEDGYDSKVKHIDTLRIDKYE